MSQEVIFDALNLRDYERKYIKVRENGVSLRFPLENMMESETGTQAGAPGLGAQARLQNIIAEFWDKETGKGSVIFKARLGKSCEAEIFKKASTEKEMHDAVLFFVKFKMKLGLS